MHTCISLKLVNKNLIEVIDTGKRSPLKLLTITTEIERDPSLDKILSTSNIVNEIFKRSKL